jgi:hypothetical protein
LRHSTARTKERGTERTSRSEERDLVLTATEIWPGFDDTFVGLFAADALKPQTCGDDGGSRPGHQLMHTADDTTL